SAHASEKRNALDRNSPSPHVTGEAAFPAPMASSSRAFESSVDSKLMSEKPGREKRGGFPRSVSRDLGSSPIPPPGQSLTRSVADARSCSATPRSTLDGQVLRAFRSCCKKLACVAP